MTQVQTPTATVSEGASAAGRPGAGALLVEQMGEAGGKREKRRDIRPLGRLLPYQIGRASCRERVF